MATLTFCLMDPPYENARSTTALRLLDAAIRKGHNVIVFAYEGAVMLPFSKQAQHANAVHGRDLALEDHPLPKDWIGALQAAAAEAGTTLEWINCGLCVDERGAGEPIAGIKRGSPADFWKAATETSDNAIVIATR
jgi:tRNA 2-thiouridine synthesizing protein D